MDVDAHDAVKLAPRLREAQFARRNPPLLSTQRQIVADYAFG
jgi:hypothetical protein